MVNDIYNTVNFSIFLTSGAHQDNEAPPEELIRIMPMNETHDRK